MPMLYMYIRKRDSDSNGTRPPGSNLSKTRHASIAPEPKLCFFLHSLNWGDPVDGTVSPRFEKKSRPWPSQNVPGPRKSKSTIETRDQNVGSSSIIDRTGATMEMTHFPRSSRTTTAKKNRKIDIKTSTSETEINTPSIMTHRWGYYLPNVHPRFVPSQRQRRLALAHVHVGVQSRSGQHGRVAIIAQHESAPVAATG